MTAILRCALAAAVLTVFASPAYAFTECTEYDFPVTHVKEKASLDELKAVVATLTDANAKINAYGACIDKMQNDPLPADATADQKKARKAIIDKHANAHDKSLANLIAAKEEFDKARAYYAKKHPSK